MKKMTINGKEINTNYGQTYYLCDGNNKNGYRIQLRNWVLDDGAKYKRPETEEEMLERLVSYGYTTIRFAETSTAVRGIHDLFAYAK